MAIKLGFIVMFLMCLLIVGFTSAQEESPSPVLSPEPESQPNSPPPPSSSPKPEPVADSPSPPPPPPQPESPSAPSPSPSSSSESPAPAPSDDDGIDGDNEPETQYFPSPTPSPAPGKPDDIQGSDNEYAEARGEEKGMSGSKKAGIAIGAILGLGAIVIGALIYKKRRDNITRARYSYFNQGEFL